MLNTGSQTLNVMSKATWYNRWLLSLIRPYLKGDILEVGTGIGNFTQMLADYGEVTTIDVDVQYINKVKQEYGNRIKVGRGDIEIGDYFFNKINFDSIVCLNVLEHIKDDRKAIKNMYELLNKGGYLILLVPANKFLFSDFDKNLGHYRRYSIKEIKSVLEESEFGIRNLRYINWWAAIGWFVFMKILKVNKMPENPVGIFDKIGKVFLFPEKIIKIPFGLSILAIAKK